MKAGSTARDGNQTLARGLRVFLAIADSEHGLSVQQVADLLDVHRSIAYRLLQTLVDHRLVARSRDGIYLPGDQLAALSDSYLPDVRALAAPIIRPLADQLQSTVSLFVEQGDEAVALSMVEPSTATHHIAFRPGMRTSMDRGAAAYALRAMESATVGEPEAVTLARERGWAFSHGEVESTAYAVAAGIALPADEPRVCLNLITYRADVAETAGEVMRKAAATISKRVRDYRSALPAAIARGGERVAPLVPQPAAGSQTLSRGLTAFMAVISSEKGMSVQDVSEQLGVHRTIAYRLLQTLLDFALVTRTKAGQYVGGARLATLADAYVPRLQDVALPVMRTLADELAATVLLFVEQNGEAVAVALCEPTTALHHIAFRAGMRTPLNEGAAAFALRASRPARPDEKQEISRARESGVARSFSAVLPGAHGVAAAIPLPEGSPPASLTLVTYVGSVADAAGDPLRAAASEIGQLLASSI